MAAVALTISETVTGSNVNDTLGGGSTGLDLGQVSNGQYTPLILQSANTGHQDLFIFGDNTVDPITDVKVYVAEYSGTYGGPANPTADLAALLAYGAADTGATANNADGNSRGLHMDMSWDVVVGSQFAPTREGTGQKRIFGKSYSGKDGASLANAFDLHVDAMSYWNGTSEVDATTPVTGKIGKSTDTVLGNRAHIRMRAYLNTSATSGGLLQFDTVISYAFTAAFLFGISTVIAKLISGFSFLSQAI